MNITQEDIEVTAYIIGLSIFLVALAIGIMKIFKKQTDYVSDKVSS